METIEILSGLKWEIIKNIAKQPTNPLEISKMTKKSLPNISQQLKILDAGNFIIKEKISNNQKNQPRSIYGIKKNISFLSIINKNFADQKELETNPLINGFLKTLLISNETIAISYFKSYFNYPIIFQSNNSIILLEHSKHHIKYLIISKDKHLLINKMHNAFINIEGKDIKIDTLIYTIEDLKSEENKELVKNIDFSKVLFDPEENIKLLKK